jgi:hypothetical protein
MPKDNDIVIANASKDVFSRSSGSQRSLTGGREVVSLPTISRLMSHTPCADHRLNDGYAKGTRWSQALVPTVPTIAKLGQFLLVRLAAYQKSVGRRLDPGQGLHEGECWL